jgi:hypothetical protein
MAVALARIRMPLIYLILALMLVDSFIRDLEGATPQGPGLRRNLQPFTVPGSWPSPSGEPTAPNNADRLQTGVPA